MAGYPVVGVSASCTHDPQGVDIYDEEGNLTHYDLGDTVPLSKLISRRYSWLVNRGYLSEVETDDWGSTVWGEISGTLSSQTDLQNALDAKLNLTGGTLTGLLTITSGANTFGFKNGGSSVTPQFHLGTSGGKSVGLLAGTSGTAFIYDSTGTFNITTDTKANIDAGTSTGGTARLTMSSTGAVTLTGDLAISKASATHTISSSSGTTNVNLDSIAGTYKYLNFRTGTSARWTLGTTATAESGSNAGTDLFIGRSSDAGAYIDSVLSITRSTGDIVLASTTDSSSSTTGAIKTAGGMGIAKKLYVGTDLNVAGTIEASDVRAISQVMGAF